MEKRLYISILNGAGSTDYLHCLVKGLDALGTVSVDVVDSDKCIGLFDHMKNVRFLNLIGPVCHDVAIYRKVARRLRYYVRLLIYAWMTKRKLFHVQWFGKPESIERTFLILYYKALGKRLIFTAHNIDRQRRDGNSSLLNRLTLYLMYHLVDRVIVHSSSMQRELTDWFDLPAHRIRILPMGMLDHLPRRGSSRDEARRKLGILPTHKVMLFFGGIQSYKGLDVLVEALADLRQDEPQALVVVAGSSLHSAEHFDLVRNDILSRGLGDHVVLHNWYVADQDVEDYFVSADCVVLPYRRIFQSAVLLTALRFGVPVVASAVGAFTETIEEGKTGFLCSPGSAGSLAAALRRFFDSPLYHDREYTRGRISAYASEHFDWRCIAKDTASIYREVLSE